MKKVAPLSAVQFYSLKRRFSMDRKDIEAADKYQTVLLEYADSLQQKKKYRTAIQLYKNWEINAYAFERRRHASCYDYYLSIYANHTYTREQTVILRSNWQKLRKRIIIVKKQKSIILL